MQALQLKRRCTFCTHLQEGCDGRSVVGRELGKNHIACRQKRTSTGQVRHVGVVLVGEYGVMRQPKFLGAFDLCIPIRAFDQAAHQAHVVGAPKLCHMVDQFQCPRLVGLHCQTQAAPLWVVLCNPSH